MNDKYVKKSRICEWCGSEYFATDFDIARGKYKHCGKCKNPKYIKKIRYCDKHGAYEMSDFDYIERGYRCKKCRTDRMTEARIGCIPKYPDFVWDDISSKDVERLRNHDFRPDKDKLTWVCPKHGEYDMLFTNHVYMKLGVERCGCPKCNKGGGRSKTEKQIEDYIKSLGYKLGPRKGILPDRKEIDIYLEEECIGVEVDGSVWHTEGTYDPHGRFISYGYHDSKDKDAEALGIKMIHINGDNWHTNSKNIKMKEEIKRMIEEGKPVRSVYDTVNSKFN